MFSAAIFTWAAAVLLIAVRLAMLFIATPVFANIPVPVIARVLLILGLSIGFAGTVHIAIFQVHDPVWLLTAVLHEMLVGAVMASGLFVGFGSFHLAGRLLDSQIGFGLAGLLDIATQNNAPLLGSLLSMLAVIMFFAVDGHLAMLRLLQLSFVKLPPGTGIANVDIGAVIAYFGSCFIFGFALVAPVVLCLFVVDVGLAFMSRTMPQMNVFVMSLVLKVVVGLSMLAIALPFAGGLTKTIFESIFNFWNKALSVP
jgi:flagellar biosynthetic protein FliR